MDEKEYIERRTAINIVLNHAGNWATAFCELKNVPSADVQEVRHGRWVDKIMRKENYNYGVPYKISCCSECLYMLNNNGFVGRYNYCPNCGARMDGE